MERRAVWHDVIAALRTGNLLYLDESGFNLGMASQYGYAPVGERVDDAIPKNPGTNTSVLAAIGLRGIVAPWMQKETMNGNSFLAYIECDLVPKLKRGDVVIMDNASIHRVEGVAAAFRRARARVIYLPPYSPDFNPIELMWSKIKSIVRRLKPRTDEELAEALRIAFASITLRDIEGWFRHAHAASQA